MRTDRNSSNPCARSAGLATSASAVVALVAVAAIMASLPGTHARAAMLEVRAVPVEAPSVRAVAAAVAAAARELVGAERFTASIHAEPVAANLIPPLALSPISVELDRAPQSHPLGERLIDLPPPGR